LAVTHSALGHFPKEGSNPVAEHIVSIVDFDYVDPQTGTSTTAAQVGDTIKWRNDGNSRHNAESSDGPHFNTGDIDPGNTSAAVPLTVASSSSGFTYTCSNHPSHHMTGHIVVSLPGTHPKEMVERHKKKSAKP
jgi:plastocyanin